MIVYVAVGCDIVWGGGGVGCDSVCVGVGCDSVCVGGGT